MPAPESPCRVYLFRHGQTDWNAQERFQGHLDIPLNETGRAQARALASRLEGLGVEAILTSDLSRARETARIVAELLRVPVLEAPGLREAHLGGAQGLTRQEIEARFGTEIVRRWGSPLATDADVSYPGGESGSQVLQRSLQAIEDLLLKTRPGTRVLGVSTHGGVIRRIMRHLVRDETQAIPIPNTVVYGLEYDVLTHQWLLAEKAPRHE